MKIVLLSSGALPVPCPGYGGLEMVVHDLATVLDEMGHEVYLVAPTGSKAEGNVHLMDCGPCNPNAREWEVQALQKIAPILLSDGFKDAVVHDHTWGKPIYLLKQQYSRLNVMSTLHGMLPYRQPPPVERPCMAGISKHHADSITAGLGIPVRFVYNGINLKNYPFTSQLNRQRYLFLARMTAFKGAHVFVDLMRQIGAEGDLVGDDQMVEDQEYVKRLMQACVSYPHVRYWGGVSRARAAEFFQRSKCYVLPCTQGWQEPFGLTVVEAMASGCPVVATASGAIPELVQEGVTGFVVPTVMDLPDLLKSGKIDTIQSEACRKRAEEFSREKMSENYITLYEECLAGGW